MQKSSENTKIYRAIGCMSGTAMDGIDIALIETDGYDYIKPIGFLSQTHDAELRSHLKTCLNKTDITEDMRHIEQRFTLAHAPFIKKLTNQFNLSKQDIDIIGFHGQTIHHDPDNRATLQLGDGALLARETGINVAHTIRQADMDKGGQGAPLLPVYHRALSVRDSIPHPVAIINIGGVGNITWINGDDIIAFDTGPGNAMIDDWVYTHTGQPFDENGILASNGTIDKTRVRHFLSLHYFSKKYPKSLDRNDFNSIDLRGMSVEDGTATLTDMTVQSIAQAVNQCPSKPQTLYITGGGRHNQTMINAIEAATLIPTLSVDTLNWNGDAIEAEGFAYMAVRTLLNEPISFPTTTGCKTPTVGGVIAHPSNKEAA